jgi:hypothetical protein
MTIQPKVVFCVTVKDTPKTLFTIYEQPDEELILAIKFAENYTTGIGGKILEQRYSIHLSPKSPDFNAIKQTFVTEHEEITAVALTDAFKKQTGFAPVYSRLCPNLSLDRYTSDTDAPQVVLGAHDPIVETFVYGVFIGNPGVSLAREGAGTVSVIEHDFSRFRVIVLADPIPMSSYHNGFLAHNLTLNPELGPESEQQFRKNAMKGQGAPQCFVLFQYLRAGLALRILDDKLKGQLTASERDKLSHFHGQCAAGIKQLEAVVNAVAKEPEEFSDKSKIRPS